MHVETPHERPLNPLAKAGLVASTAGVIIAFYLLAFVAAILLLALLALELALVLAAARIGLAGWMARVMEAHVRVVGMLFRSLWLRSGGAEYRIALNDTDAPQLFQILNNLCQRFAIKPPEKVQLAMGTNAWVHLKGYRTGAGSTQLGLGYDLLCGLTVSEVEAVLAHEMAHAKLVQRGFKKFAGAALNRCATLVHILKNYVAAAREAKKDHAVASLLLGPFNALIRTLARLVAAYSRQDEFEADRGAAEVCGPNSLRSSLLKLDAIAEASSRLPWRERVAQLQSGEGFTEWFGREIAAALLEPIQTRHHLFDQYATHPNLPDRLGALPPDIEKEVNNSPGIALLAAPDSVAQRLVEEIHRVAAIEEEKDSKAVAKWARRQFRTRAMNWKHLPGLVLCGVGGILFLYGVIERGAGFIAAAVGVVSFVAGVFAFRLGRYRDPRQFPVPGYGELVRASERKYEFDKQDEMAKEFEEKIAGEKGSSRKYNVLLTEAYNAITNCDFLRAHVLARLCFKHKKQSIEAHLAFAVAAAELRQARHAVDALRFVQYHTGFTSPSTAWAAAWVFAMIAEFALAEALLEKVVRNHPENKTFLAILAIARSRRGKINSAILAARKACTPSPPSSEHAILLMRLLVDAGLLREASSWLNAVAQQAKDDSEIQFQTLRIQLLKRDFEAADATTRQLLQGDSSIQRLLLVGNVYQQARKFEIASSYFTKVLEQGHYPEALVALGEIAAEKRDKAKARLCLLSALSLKTPPAKDAVHPARLFQRINYQLCALEQPAYCTGWTVYLPPAIATKRCHEALHDIQFVVYGPDEAAAQQSLQTVLLAADANYPIVGLIWTKLPKSEQPVRPVRPGVQRVTSLGAS
jgi:Zn-dependent protease with chaperone function